MLERMKKSPRTRKHDAGPEKRDPTRDTREQLRELIQKDRERSAEDLAAELGIAKSRVFILAKKLGYGWVARWKKVT